MEAEQGALEIVHWNMFVPNPSPVIEVVAESEFVIVPMPETNDHAPVPTVAVLAVISVLGLLIQTVCEVPAFDAVGILFTVIATVEDDDVQGALVIVHLKIFVPIARPVTVVPGESEFVIIPVPETNVQAPVPTAGKFPFKVVVGEDTQSVWFDPAFAIVGI